MRTGDLREMREIRLRQDGEVLELLLKLEEVGAPQEITPFRERGFITIWPSWEKVRGSVGDYGSIS